PYLYGTFTLHGERVNDYFISASIVGDPLGVWFLTGPFGAPLYMVELVGLLGLVWYWKTRWWARPMLLLVAGVYVYRWALVLIFVGNGHTLYLHYTSRLIGLVFASAGVLTAVTAVPALARRVTKRSLRGVALLGTATLLVVAGLASMNTWMPSPRGINDVSRPADSIEPNLATYTHAEPLPNGKRPRYAAKGVTVVWFPVESIREVVEGTLGEGARPSTLAYDERMFAYYPWNGYVAVHRLAANTFSHWDERHAELVRIAGIKDPAEFARASADTEYGGIDVFVLRRRPAGWMWGDVVFDAAQFNPTYWRVADDLPSNTAVAVRLPG
ncbi:arabinofuranosyltransferase, partial [Plantactinospora solaniradicis]